MCGDDGRALNVLIAIRNGEIIARYDKLHLYDAFAMQESRNVTPGNEVPPLVEVAGMKVGLMTCYDVRFRSRRVAWCWMARMCWCCPRPGERAVKGDALGSADNGARAGKHLLSGGCGRMRPAQYWQQLVVDPLGVAIAKAAEAPALVFADLDPARIAHAREVLPVLANRRFARPELK